jgi:exopolysaccharide production protein ExoQ
LSGADWRMRSQSGGGGAKAGLWRSDGKGAGAANLIIWLLVVVMIVPQGLDYKMVNGLPTGGDLPSRIIWLLIVGGSVAILYAKRANLPVFFKTLNPFLLLYLGLALASTLWSIDPPVTIRRLIRISSILVACLSFALIGWHRQKLQDVLRQILTVAMVASIVVSVALPDIGQLGALGEPDSWNGITGSKNLLGTVASTTIVLWVIRWLSTPKSAIQSLCGIAAGGVCLVESHSSTSLMATVFAVGFAALLLRSPNTLRRYMPYLVTLFGITILIYALAVLRLVPALGVVLKPITMLTGKDLTFSHRTDIWDIINEQIQLHPLLGGGYGAYWTGVDPSTPSYEMVLRLFYYPTESHNGYLDVINDLGIVGILCLVGYLAVFIRQGLQLFRIDRYEGGLILTLLFRALLANMSEVHWFSSFSIDFAFMSMATASVARSLIQAKVASRPGPAQEARPLPPRNNEPPPRGPPLRRPATFRNW